MKAIVVAQKRCVGSLLGRETRGQFGTYLKVGLTVLVDRLGVGSSRKGKS